MNDNLEVLLSRLDKVEKLTPGAHQARYKACCPAHDDKNPSLSITLANSGAILLKCWSGCSAHDVISAVGMEMTQLFPDKREHHSRPAKRPFSADQAAKSVSADAMLLAMVAGKLRKNEQLTKEEMDAVLDAHTRASTISRGL